MGKSQSGNSSSEQKGQRRTTRVAILVIITVFVSPIVGAGVIGAPLTSTVIHSTPSDNQPSFLDDNRTQTKSFKDVDPNITIKNFSAPTRSRLGESYTINVTFKSDASNPTVHNVQYRIAGNVIKSKLVQIPARTTKMVTFSITARDTAALPRGTYVHGIFTAGTHVTANLTLASSTKATRADTTSTTTEHRETIAETPRGFTTTAGIGTTVKTTTEGVHAEDVTTTAVERDSFVVSEITVPPQVQEGTTFSVSATVSNPNNHRVTQTVKLRLNGSVTQRKTITLNPNEQTQTTFSIETSTLPPQDYRIGVYTRNFGEVTIVTVGNLEEGRTTMESG